MATLTNTLILTGTVLTAAVGAVHVLLYKSDSRAAAGWLALVLVLPLAGPTLYWFFGINRIRRHQSTLRGPRWSDQSMLPPVSGKEPARALERVGWRITGEHLTPSDRIGVLSNGEAAFPAMLEAIRQAEHEVLLATFIFDPDRVGDEFVAALAAAQARGVTVAVLIDAIGRRFRLPTILPKLEAAGLRYRSVTAQTRFWPSMALNLRNHRKLLIVDSRLAYAGGMNISARHLVADKAADGAGKARDLHFLMRGPVVQPLRQVFCNDWRDAGGAPLPPAPAARAPPPSHAAEAQCRVVPDGPDERLDHLALLLEGVLSAAERRVLIVNPYFLPNQRLIGALQGAVLRGVAVTVVVPAHNNWPIVRWALGHIAWQLVGTGVRLYEQTGLFDHSKYVVVDDHYALIGSANLDERSLRLNFELGIEVFGTALNEELRRRTEQLLSGALPLTLERLSERTVPVRLRDAAAALFSPYL